MTDLTALRERLEAAEDALLEIKRWAEAYPETAFSEPDFNRMREVLTAAGMPTALDAAHGTWGRHITKGIHEIAAAALTAGEVK